MLECFIEFFDVIGSGRSIVRRLAWERFVELGLRPEAFQKNSFIVVGLELLVPTARKLSVPRGSDMR